MLKLNRNQISINSFFSLFTAAANFLGGEKNDPVWETPANNVTLSLQCYLLAQTSSPAPCRGPYQGSVVKQYNCKHLKPQCVHSIYNYFCSVDTDWQEADKHNHFPINSPKSFGLGLYLNLSEERVFSLPLLPFQPVFRDLIQQGCISPLRHPTSSPAPHLPPLASHPWGERG